MRLFTAIDLPEQVVQSLSDFLDRMRPLARIRWSPVANLHITTKFIGEWPEAKLTDMKRALSNVKAAPCEIAIRGLGWFPHQKRPRVFWAGVDGGEPLRTLAHATEQAVAKLGVAVEKREFSPHLTLARIETPSGLDGLQREATANAERDFGRFHASSFYLYLSAAGRYTKLADFSL
jgi:2'-5' RNA ligase